MEEYQLYAAMFHLVFSLGSAILRPVEMPPPDDVSDELAGRPVRFGLIWLGSALTVLALSCLRIFPIVSLATLLSDDHSLTSTYVASLQDSQWMFAVLGILLSPLAFAAPALLRLQHGLLHNVPGKIFWPVLGSLLFGATWMVQTFLFQGIPHVTDAISHLFQAKIFALGRLQVMAPPCIEHFLQYNISFTTDGHWLSIYPPGHALTLLPALKFHLLPLYGPACTTGTLLTCAWIVQRFFGRPYARAFALLFSTSPMMLLIGGSFMSHISLLLCLASGLALGLHGLDRFAAQRSAFACFAGSGFLLGLAALIRPQDVIVLVPTILLGIIWSWRHVVPALRNAIPGLLTGLAIPVAAQLFWNHQIFGSIFALGYGRTDTGSIVRGAVPVFGFTDNFTLRHAVQQLVWTLARLDTALLGWPLCLLFIGFTFMRRRPDRRDIIALTAVGIVTAFYFTYDYYAREYEARFYSAFVPFLIILVLRGLGRLREWRPLRAAIPLLGLLLTLHGFIFYWPGHIIPNYGQDYEQASPIVHRLAREAGLTKALVLIDASDPNDFRYSAGFIYNDPELAGNIIYALDLPGENNCLFKAFPDRTIYRFRPNEEWTDGEFELQSQNYSDELLADP
ncbi:MAG TPA: hypothetical protein PLT37_00585 [Kiritimatiellia bacterium]|nr:hypothetical protein [Kiritimatiellia bacterium]HQF19720.1 hypothetical protein [Kiritimatiellia bacterium]HQG73674.1 hypothetical protein [Kiritimatiellia bacterium]